MPTTSMSSTKLFRAPITASWGSVSAIYLLLVLPAIVDGLGERSFRRPVVDCEASMQRLVRHLQQLSPFRQDLCLPAERDVSVVRPVAGLLDHRGPATVLPAVRTVRVLPLQRQAGRAVTHLG